MALSHPSIRPPHGAFQEDRRSILENGAAIDEHERPIGQLRWSPVPIPDESLSFITGIRTMTTAGDANTQTGISAHIYFVTAVND